MSHTTAELPELPPLSASDDIRHALADVDARLSAWVTAITEAQAALAQANAEAAAGIQIRTNISGPAPAVLADPDARTVEISPASGQTETQAAVEGPAANLETPPEQPADPPAINKKPEPEHQPALQPEAEPEPVDVQATHEEDEALLAALDPETAKAIRVMRRLSVERKSVRQLLTEYKESQASQPQALQKKSWWTRG